MHSELTIDQQERIKDEFEKIARPMKFRSRISFLKNQILFLDKNGIHNIGSVYDHGDSLKIYSLVFNYNFTINK